MNAWPQDAGRTGLVVPVITPLDAAERIDEPAFRAVIRRCLEAGADGVFAGGSAGMGPLLPDDQWQRAMEIARDEVQADRMLQGGVIATSTARAVHHVRVLERLGIESMVVTSPFYLPLSHDDEYLAYFGACREAADIRMVVYNIPSFTGGNIPVGVIERMGREGWIRLIKESSGDRTYFAAVLEACSEVGVGVMQGYEPDIAWGLSIGAAGIVPVCANYDPQTFVAAISAARRKDAQRLEQAQQRASLIRQELGVDRPQWIAGIMYAVSILGIGSGKPIHPLAELSPEVRQRVKAFCVRDAAVRDVLLDERGSAEES